MDTKETNEVKAGLKSLPEFIKKIEAYFNVEKPEAAKVEGEKKEEAKETPAPEQDFSAVISAIEKSFTKTSDFEGFKTSIIEASVKVTENFAAITAKNEALEAKFIAQDAVIKEIFELVKKIGDTPSEESKFAKKDGAKVESKTGNMNKWMEEASVLSKQIFK